MKKYCILLGALFFFNSAVSQVKDLSANEILLENTNKTLKAATSQCALSFIFLGTGVGLVIADVDFVPLAVTIGLGGAGVGTHITILTNRAYKQIQKLNFQPDDLALQTRMLKNIKTARTLAIIQNMTPIVAAVVGGINYSLSEQYDDFYFSTSFWAPALSIVAVGMILIIPEIVLIEKTRHDLNTYRGNLTLGTTEYGMGISFKF